MKKAVYFLFVCATVITCKTPERVSPTITPSRYSVIGTWYTKSCHITAYRNDTLFYDSLLLAPYKGVNDILESLRFTDKVFLAKNINESEMDIVDGILYTQTDKYIIFRDMVEVDTAFTIKKLNLQQFDFTYVDSKTDDRDNIKVIYAYVSVK